MLLFNNFFMDYKSQLEDSQGENKRISSDLDDYKLQLKLFQYENKRITDDLDDYKSRLQISQDENKQLVDEYKQLVDEYKQLVDENKQLVDENKQLSSDSELYQYEKHEMNATVNLLKTLHHENKKLKEELMELRRKVINKKLVEKKV